VPGTDFVGILPQEIQYISVFSAALVTGSGKSSEAGTLIAFLGSAKTKDAIRDSGMEPLPLH
jgi:molybdate transport system substrate-binding protein